MGKNHRHTKKLKSERSKIKLKTQKTKFLPKGLNVTDTNFKIKPIVIPEQLVQHKTQVTSKNLDFKDIINRLKHHNTAVNLNSLQQLKEFIYMVGNNSLDKYILQICEQLCPLYINIDQKLRREAITLTHHLIKLVKSVGIEPHINRIISYLCCMMTHLNENVQEDSLRLFDVLIQSIPGLLAARCDKIIQNFIVLISKVKICANDKSMLQSTIKNNRTSIEWRLMVLTRFNEFLWVILGRKKRENQVGSVPVGIITVRTQRICVPVYYKKKEIDIFGEDVNVDVWLDDCVKDVLGLLKGIWLEVQPSNKHSIQSAQLFCTVINNEVLNILHCILSIISSFYELMVIKTRENQQEKIENEAFLTTSKEIITLIFESFPFSKQNLKNPTDSRCFEENLTLCYLFFALSAKNYDKNLLDQALAYLNVCLVNRNYVPQEKSQFLLKALKQFFEINLKLWNKHNLNNFLNNTAKYYVNNDLPGNGVEILRFLCDHIDLIEGNFFDVIRKACKTLIGAKIDVETYKLIRVLLLREIHEVDIALSLILPQILNNLNTIEFEGIEDQGLKQIRILSLFKNVPLNVKSYRVLEEFGKVSNDNKKLVNDFFNT